MHTTYDVVVTREDRWWMIAVPAIDGLTQARRVTETAAALKAGRR